MKKYKMIGVLRSGVSVVVAESDDLEELEGLLAKIATEMCDPTSYKYILEHGHHVTSVKDISSAYIEEVFPCL